MQPLKTYDYLMLARQRVFDWIRPLSAEQYAREFPFAHRTLAATLTHILSSEWYYVQRIAGRSVPPYEEWAYRPEKPLPFAELEAAWTKEAGLTRAALAGIADWTTDLEYHVTGDDGRPAVVNASPSDIFTQLALHEVHHRAQALVMLRQLGTTIDDLDYNALMYRRRVIAT
jgi:uncharacterized damage-inducible protein DinB